jgi:hypothetical protein
MKMNQLLTIGGITAALFLSAGSVSAQTNNDNAGGVGGGPRGVGGGNSDPAQQRFMARVHDALGFTNETEWNAVQPLVQKVFEAQRDVARGGSVSRMLPGNRGGNGTNAIAGARSGRAVFFGQPTPEAQALQQAIDDNAPDAQIEAALKAYEASQKAKQAKLVQAQKNLRKALNKKQEAQAALLRLLD